MPQMTVRGYTKAVPIVAEKQYERESYNIYVTDALKAIVGNTKNYIIPGHGAVEYGTVFERRFVDIISGREPEPEESAEDVIDRITKKLTRGENGRS